MGYLSQERRRRQAFGSRDLQRQRDQFINSRSNYSLQRNPGGSLTMSQKPWRSAALQPSFRRFSETSKGRFGPDYRESGSSLDRTKSTVRTGLDDRVTTLSSKKRTTPEKTGLFKRGASRVRRSRARGRAKGRT